MAKTQASCQHYVTIAPEKLPPDKEPLGRRIGVFSDQSHFDHVGQDGLDTGGLVAPALELAEISGTASGESAFASTARTAWICSRPSEGHFGALASTATTSSASVCYPCSTGSARA